MRILILTDRYPPYITGGYEVACAAVAERLRGLGHDVRVLTTQYGVGRPHVDGHVSRILHRPQDCRRMLDLGWAEAQDRRRLRRLIARLQPDVIYAWSMFQLFPSLHRTVRNSGVPVVLNIQDAWLPWQIRQSEEQFELWYGHARPLVKRAMHAAVAKALRIQDRRLQPADLVCRNVVFCSAFRWRQHLQLGLPLESSAVIYNGVELSLFNAAAGRGAGVRALFAGRLVASKGAHTAIDAMAVLRAAGIDDVSLAVAGAAAYPWAYADELRRRIADRGLGRQVTVLGAISHDAMPRMYADFNVLVFPSSDDEGLPMTVLEAMAAGMAVVATATGGTVEIIEDGVTGLLFPPGNAAVLAKCLMRLHADRSLRARLGAQARAVAERRFDLSKIADQTVSYLQEVAATVGARNRVAAA